MFQQDNDPKHTATNWFTDEKIKVLDCPSQSSDFNPIEHLQRNSRDREASFKNRSPSGSSFGKHENPQIHLRKPC